MESRTRGITERQKRFADYCVETGNARQAAIRAGFTPNYANKLRKMPAIRAYIDEQIKRMDDERIAGSAEVLRYLTGVMRGECGDESFAARMKAAELLGKRLGVFDQPQEEYGDVVVVDDVGQGERGDEAE